MSKLKEKYLRKSKLTVFLILLISAYSCSLFKHYEIPGEKDEFELNVNYTDRATGTSAPTNETEKQQTDYGTGKQKLEMSKPSPPLPD